MSSSDNIFAFECMFAHHCLLEIHIFVKDTENDVFPFMSHHGPTLTVRFSRDISLLYKSTISLISVHSVMVIELECVQEWEVFARRECGQRCRG